MGGVGTGGGVATDADSLCRSSVAEPVGDDALFVMRSRVVERHTLIPVPIGATGAVGGGLEVDGIADGRGIGGIRVQLFDARRAKRPVRGFGGGARDDVVRADTVEPVG